MRESRAGKAPPSGRPAEALWREAPKRTRSPPVRCFSFSSFHEEISYVALPRPRLFPWPFPSPPPHRRMVRIQDSTRSERLTHSTSVVQSIVLCADTSFQTRASTFIYLFYFLLFPGPGQGVHAFECGRRGLVPSRQKAAPQTLLPVPASCHDHGKKSWRSYPVPSRRRLGTHNLVLAQHQQQRVRGAPRIAPSAMWSRRGFALLHLGSARHTRDTHPPHFSVVGV